MIMSPHLTTRDEAWNKRMKSVKTVSVMRFQMKSSIVHPASVVDAAIMSIITYLTRWCNPHIMVKIDIGMKSGAGRHLGLNHLGNLGAKPGCWFKSGSTPPFIPRVVEFGCTSGLISRIHPCTPAIAKMLIRYFLENVGSNPTTGSIYK